MTSFRRHLLVLLSLAGSAFVMAATRWAPSAATSMVTPGILKRGAVVNTPVSHVDLYPPLTGLAHWAPVIR